eukprot:5302840-Amphidinium_carterae.1
MACNDFGLNCIYGGRCQIGSELLCVNSPQHIHNQGAASYHSCTRRVPQQPAIQGAISTNRKKS